MDLRMTCKKAISKGASLFGGTQIGSSFTDCSYPGIFAAGDVTIAFGKRVIIVAGEGAKAALSAHE